MSNVFDKDSTLEPEGYEEVDELEEELDDEELVDEYVDESHIDDLGDYEAYDDDAEEINKSPELSTEEKAIRHKGIRRRILAVIIVLIICVITGAVCGYFFLRVKTITVSGTTKYSIKQIVDACGVESGDNLVLLDGKIVENNLKSAFPYIETVKLTRQYPTELKIVISESKPRFSVPYNGMFAYVSHTGKLLEMANAKAINTIVLIGGNIKDSGGFLNFENSNVNKVYLQINEYLNERSTGITQIDISDIYDIKVKYDDRVLLMLGGPSDLRYKLNFGLQIVMGSGIGESEYGRLDLTLANDNNKAYFTPTSEQDINGDNGLGTQDKSWYETFAGSGREIDGVDIVETATPDPSLALETPRPRDEQSETVLLPESAPEPTAEPTLAPTPIPFTRGDDIPDF